MFIPFISILAVAITAFPRFSRAATAEEWRSRSIYQVMTDRFARTDLSTTALCEFGWEGFCGGTYVGLIEKLPYIQGMGFDAVWISPVTKQVTDPTRAYNGYTQVDLYNLNEMFGFENDLVMLSDALHARGMYLMVDVVTNHFGFDGLAALVDHSLFNPFNEAKYFNEICWNTEANTADMVKCWLGDKSYPLPDLNTTQTEVREMYNDWISSLVANYSIDGLRIDSVKNVELDFWPGFQKAAGVYAVGEVSDGNVDFVCDYQGALDGVLDYPGYYQAVDFYSNTSAPSVNLTRLIDYTQYKCNDSSVLGSFSENHDQPRFANKTDDYALAKNMLTYTILSDGIPIVYAGQEQHYSGGDSPWSREATWLSDYNTEATLYTHITALNAIRKQAIATSDAYTTSLASVIYSDDHNIVLKKGSTGSQLVTVTTNFGSEADAYTLNLNATDYDAGTAITEVLSCGTSTVDDDGILEANVSGGLPLVFYPTEFLKGSSICDN